MTHDGYTFGDSRLPERFWRKIEITSTGCWQWRVCADAYAKFWWNGERKRAHRLTYEMFVSAIPNRLVPDHLCRNTRCCNPAHLELVTQKENTDRGIGPTAHNAAKTACGVCGSPYHISPKGKRVCKPCHNKKSKEQKRIYRSDPKRLELERARKNAARRLKYATDPAYRDREKEKACRAYEHRKLLRNPGAAEEPAGIRAEEGHSSSC